MQIYKAKTKSEELERCISKKAIGNGYLPLLSKYHSQKG